jgi:hypothetical protein
VAERQGDHVVREAGTSSTHPVILRVSGGGSRTREARAWTCAWEPSGQARNLWATLRHRTLVWGCKGCLCGGGGADRTESKATRASTSRVWRDAAGHESIVGVRGCERQNAAFISWVPRFCRMLPYAVLS